MYVDYFSFPFLIIGYLGMIITLDSTQVKYKPHNFPSIKSKRIGAMAKVLPNYLYWNFKINQLQEQQMTKQSINY